MRKVFFILACVLVSTVAFAQESNCSNGIDDDGDGFVDCYDSDCANAANCDGTFVGNNGCQIPPPPAPAFTMTLDFSSDNQTTNHLARMAIGDLDRDGTPEIVTMNKYTKQLVILNGNDGSTKKMVTMANNATPEYEIAIANIDNDACAEIFFLGTDSRIYVYDCNLTFLYRTEAMPGGNDPINFGLADFDGDGKVEIYAKDQIFDAHSGRRLVKTTLTNNQWGNQLNGGPVAVDMDGDKRLELVIGLSIYRVNIPAGRGTDAGSLTLLNSRSEYFVRNAYNATSVADFDQDGTLDVIASGSTGCHGNNTTIFFWSVGKNTLMTYSDRNAMPGKNDYKNGWNGGTGRVNIADLDGDGKLNLAYVSGGYLYALREDMTKLWRVEINEETSGYTGCTLFDFNGDGKSEIVYRDEQYLYIIDGTDGSIFNQQNCISRTNREYPIVADVDADGSTEICVTCGYNDTDAWKNFNTLSYSTNSHIRVFKSAAEPWVPARQVWNQHGYFVVNVNDDLTIPRQQQIHHIEYPLGPQPCRPGDAYVEQKPLNKFLNQSPFINQYGCPAYSAPDIAFASDVSIVAPVCPDLNFRYSFDITNLGDVDFSGTLPISIYSGNPLKAGAVKLQTISFNIAKLRTNEIYSIVDQTINSTGADSLFIVLNDAGTTTAPITLPNTDLIECNQFDIVGVAIKPYPVALVALEESPHVNCNIPPTGSVRAFVPGGSGAENTADYNFYWFDGTSTGPISDADFTGPIYAELTDGMYSVFAVHKTALCSSDTAQVEVRALPGVLPELTVTTISNHTSCAPANGSLQATVAGGNSGYTFEWEDAGAPIGVTGALLTGMPAGNYTVIARKNGCTTSADGVIGDETIEPEVTIVPTHIVNCSDLSSGALSATASLDGVDQAPTDFTFDWYFYDNATSQRGSLLPAVHGTGPNRTGLPAGFYQLVVKRNSTLCEATPQVVEIKDNTAVPTVVLTELAPQTSCDPASPNGRLQAVVSIGGVTQPAGDFTFEWFEGQNTLPASAHTSVSGTNGSIAEGVKGGGQTYTVRVTTASQCVATADAAVTENVETPVVTLTATPNGICDATLATGAFTGSVTASVTFGGSTVSLPDPNYTFTWYEGTLASGTPLTPESFELAALDSGYYTVIATRTDLSCSSTAKTARVTNTTVLPNVTADANASTNCLPLIPGVTPNGSVQVTDVDGLGTPAKYTFQWYRGNTASGDLIASAAVSPDTLQGATGKYYTVLVTNTTDGCQNTATVELQDGHVLPQVSLTAFPNSICDPSLTDPQVQFNGRVESAITNQGGSPISDYRFTWTDEGNGTQVLQATGTTGEVLANRDSRVYALVVRQESTGCESDPVSAEVTSETTLPAITTVADASTTCLPLPSGATPNGSVRVTDVDGAGTPASYTFEWFRGINATGTAFAGTAASPDTLQGGSNRFYTVLVTNRIDGCQNTQTVELPDESAKPVITLQPTDNSICDPVIAGTSYNGSVLVQSISYKGAPYTGSLSYQWFDGAGTSAPNTSSSTATLSGIGAGTYSATVTMTDLYCVADYVSAEVKDAVVLPVIDTTPTASTNCDGGTPNGSIAATVNVSGTPTTTGYVFQWYAGASDGDPALPASPNQGNTATVIQLQGGQNFTVAVTNAATGCKNTETVFLIDDQQLPVISPLAFTPNENCTAPYNGTASLDATTPFTYRGTTVSDPYSGFSFIWSGGTVSASGDQISGLAPGTYTLKVVAGSSNAVTSNNDNCISNPVQVTILSDLTYPSVDITKTNQSSCDDTLPNGQLAAVETSGSGSYSFAWYAGIGVGAAGSELDEVTDGTTTPVLTAGDYTLLVTNTNTRCETIESVTLVDNITLPALMLLQASPVTQCANPNGEITATPTITSTSNGDFTIFYLKQNTTDPDVVKNNAATYSSGNNADFVYANLGPGYYSSLIRDEITHCESQVITVQVLDNTAPADITIDAVHEATFCNTSDGGINISVNGVGPFAFNWHRGGPTNAGPYDYIADEDGTYLPTFGPDVAPFPLTTEDIHNLPVGLYTVEVVDARGCGTVFSHGVPFLSGPTVSAVKTNSTQCDPDNGDGTITTTFAGVNNYTVNLYRGLNPIPADAVDTDGPLALNGIVSSTSLNPGSYLIEVVDNVIDCPVYETVTIDIDPRNPVVTLGTIMPNTSCLPNSYADGSVEITIEKDPNDVRNPALTPFEYEITAISPAPLSGTFPVTVATGTASASTTLNGFGPKQYKITVTELASGCTIDRFVTVPDQPVVPALSVADIEITNDSFCAPLSNGSAEVIAIDPISIPDYQFSWFSNATLSTVLYQANGGGGAGELFNATKPGYALGTTGQGIGTQTYYVRGQRLPNTGTGVGCSTPAIQVVILDEHVAPTLTLAAAPNTSCDPVFGEGSISVQTVTNSTDLTVKNALYTYAISPDPNAVGVLANQSGALATPYIRMTDNGGAAYTVSALNQVNGCETVETVEIKVQRYALSITDALISDKLICLPDGDITATQVTIDRSLTSMSSQVFNAPLSTDFEFRWFKNVPGTFTSGSHLRDGSSTIIDTEQFVIGTGAGEYADAAATGGAGTYYVVARQRTGADKFGANCETAPLRVEILDKSVKPVIALESFSNTSCDPVTFEGSINVIVTDNSPVAGPFDYNYTWSALTAGRTAPATPSNPYSGANNTFINIQDGVYELAVTNTMTGCEAIPAQTTVPRTAVPIIIPSATSVAQLLCFPDGSIMVDSITVGGTRVFDHNEFDFKWYRNDPSTAEIVPVAAGNDVLDVTDAFTAPMTMGAGTYYVKVQRIAGSLSLGCESPALRVEVAPGFKNPVAQLIPTPNTACDVNFEGALQLIVTNPGSVATPTYTYDWDEAFNPMDIELLTGFPTTGTINNDGNGSTTPVADGDNPQHLKHGTYRVKVYNDVTGCSTTLTSTITPSPVPVVIANVSKNDQMICLPPDGSISVDDILVGGVADADHNNFAFSWYHNDPQSAPFVPVAVGNNVLDHVDYASGIGEGIYYVRVKRQAGVHLGSGCESSAYPVRIYDLSQDPDIDFDQLIPNSSCDPMNPNGAIMANAFERDGTTDNYTFDWAFNNGALPASAIVTDNSPATQVVNAGEGNYVLRVLNTVTGCRFESGVQLQLNQSLSLPNIVQVAAVNPVDCLPTGSARVVEITVGGVNRFTNPPDDLDAHFTYAWTKGTSPAVIASTSTLTDQFPDNYFVTVEDQRTSCISSPVQVLIDAADIVYPSILTRQTAPQVICDVTLGGSGALATVIDLGKPVNSRNALGNYDISWYPNLDTLGSPINMASDTVLVNQLAGNYSVKVLDRTTNCRAKAVFVINDDSFEFKPNLALTSAPLTECDSIDGSVLARAIYFAAPGTRPIDRTYPFDYNYHADFYTGSPSNLDNPGPDLPVVAAVAGPMSQSFLQPNLMNGMYTVRMTDVNTGCVTVGSITVDNAQVFPHPVITTIAPVTNCDPDRPNGVARALVDGSYIGYRFEWFEGNAPTGTPVYSGIEYGALKVAPTVYTVRATNVVTGCSDVAQATINDGTVPILPPSIDILAHLTNCITPNGALTASVDGNTANYIFNWSDGTQEVMPPAHVGEYYTDLAAGAYSVVAISRITGCKSPSVSENIIEKFEYPEVDFNISNAVCGLDNGSATVIITSDIGIQSIVWTGSGLTATGPNLSQAPRGTYSVTVTTLLGCSATETINIDTEIRPFNGISRESSPGQNDYFHIDCIEEFQDNVVKIYNRAGTLVYEGHGYDNANILFDGKSNKGISPMGTDLPDGTYFFIVDKRDGSKPVSGYLELVK